MYWVQALWTQAREQLKVTTVICSNSKYAILGIEMGRQKPKHKGRKPNAKQLLTLTNPSIDWVALAKGYGVPAASVSTADALADALATSFATPGPFLVEACLS